MSSLENDQPPATRPSYPPGLVQTLAVKDGVLAVRPIGPADAQALTEMIRRADPSDVRFRFHMAVREVPPAWIRRLTDIDYGQEMALVALMGEEIVCVARLVCEPGCESAEFALAVRSDQQRRGIGRGMMGLLLDYARGRGIGRVWGDIEVENRRMLDLAHELGFAAQGAPELGEVRVALNL